MHTGDLPQLGAGWGSGRGLLVLPASQPSTRRDARELLSLVEKMLNQPLLAASLYAPWPNVLLACN